MLILSDDIVTIKSDRISRLSVLLSRCCLWCRKRGRGRRDLTVFNVVQVFLCEQTSQLKPPGDTKGFHTKILLQRLDMHDYMMTINTNHNVFWSVVRHLCYTCSRHSDEIRAGDIFPLVSHRWSADCQLCSLCCVQVQLLTHQRVGVRALKWTRCEITQQRSFRRVQLYFHWSLTRSHDLLSLTLL